MKTAEEFYKLVAMPSQEKKPKVGVNEPNPSAEENGDALETELDNLKSKGQVLQDTHQRNDEATGEELQAAKYRIAELEDEVNKVKASIAQVQDMAAEAARASACPECGKPGFTNSTPQQFLLGPRYLKCSWCGYKKQTSPGLFGNLKEE